MGTVGTVRQGDREISAHGHIFRITAVYGVAGECGCVAEVLHAVRAEPAIAIDAAHPGDTNASSDGQIGGSAFCHFADNLMAGNNARLDGREIAFDDVEIGAANAAGKDFEQDVSGLGLRPRDILDREPSGPVWSTRGRKRLLSSRTPLTTSLRRRRSHCIGCRGLGGMMDSDTVSDFREGKARWSSFSA